jgi:hypothetical protein
MIVLRNVDQAGTTHNRTKASLQGPPGCWFLMTPTSQILAYISSQIMYYPEKFAAVSTLAHLSNVSLC